MNINRVELTGNVSRAAEVKATKDGKFVVSFGLAVGEGFGERQRTHFIDCVRFCATDAQARFFEQLAKGQKVAIAGSLSQSRWESQGQKRSKIEVIVREIDTIGQAPARDARDYAQGQQIPLAAAPRQSDVELFAEDIPF